MNEEEYNRRNFRLHTKYQNNEPFTEEERCFFCENLCAEDIEKIKFCKDEYYLRLFVKFHHTFSDDYPKIPKFVITHRELLRFHSLINDWKQVVKKTNHSGRLLQFVSKETREEIKRLKQSFSILLIGYSTYEHIKREQRIYMFSKFLYLLCKSILVNYPFPGYKFIFQSKDIYFDEFSFAHILFRHYGQIMKQYETGKSYFDDFFFDYRKLPEKIEEILINIERSGLFTENDFENIIFRFNGKVYSIYIQKETRQEKGKGNVEYLRINTIFPVLEAEKIAELNAGYHEEAINKELYVFIKNN